jgi:hypothetical protein
MEIQKFPYRVSRVRYGLRSSPKTFNQADSGSQVLELTDEAMVNK